MKDNFVPILLVVAIGGVIVYFLTRPNPVLPPAMPAVAPPLQCGGSYAGAGVSVPCQLIGQGIKTIVADAGKVLQKYGVTDAVKTTTSGFDAKDVVLFPYAVNHAAYNDVKAGVNKVISWL